MKNVQEIQQIAEVFAHYSLCKKQAENYQAREGIDEDIVEVLNDETLDQIEKHIYTLLDREEKSDKASSPGEGKNENTNV